MMRRWVQVGAVVALMVAMGAGSVQAVSGLGGAVEGPRGYGVRGYAGGYAGQAAQAIWYGEGADSFSLVLAFGATGAAADSDYIGYIERPFGFMLAITVACRDGDLVATELWPDRATYIGAAVTRARMKSRTPLQGSEYRVPDCEHPKWNHETDTDIAPIPDSSIQVDITGTGDRRPYLNTDHSTSFPACAWATTGAGLHRGGQAKLTFPNPENTGIDLTGLTILDAALAAGSGSYGDVAAGSCYHGVPAGLWSRNSASRHAAMISLMRRWTHGRHAPTPR